VFLLSHELDFPATHYADHNGLLALGGDLTVARLQLAYSRGIFPWYSEGEQIMWFCPPSRMVLFPENIKISKSMGQVLRSKRFRVTFNMAFEEVISNCKTIDRYAQGENETWITNEMKMAYVELFKIGTAKSIEVWEGDTLVGGLYGVEVGSIFCGESMFSSVSNASKLAFIHLAQNNRYKLIDCQIYNPHLASLGAQEIDRDLFLEILRK